VGVAVDGRLAPVHDRSGGSMSDLWEEESVGAEPAVDDDDEWEEGDDEPGLEEALDESDELDDESWDEGEED
jgi:hypothetical protein